MFDIEWLEKAMDFLVRKGDYMLKLLGLQRIKKVRPFKCPRCFEGTMILSDNAGSFTTYSMSNTPATPYYHCNKCNFFADGISLKAERELRESC